MKSVDKPIRETSNDQRATRLDLNFSICHTHEKTPQRLDAYVAHCLSESRATLKDWFKEGRFLLNQQKSKPSAAVQNHALVTIKNFVPMHHRRIAPNTEIQIPIIYQDDHIWIMNKPRGMAVNALTYQETDCIANFLLAMDPRIPQWDVRQLEPGVVHRLDQWTSGCLIGVRTPLALENIQKQFKNRRVTKIYLALVEGQIYKADEWIDHLIHDPKNNRKMRCVDPALVETTPKTRRARLSFIPLKKFQKYTVVEVRLHTGRMHQIRVQFASRGFPLAGDKLYGAKSKVPFEGQWLHAQMLSFFHPVHHERMLFRAPLPQALRDFSDSLC